MVPDSVAGKAIIDSHSVPVQAFVPHRSTP